MLPISQRKTCKFFNFTIKANISLLWLWDTVGDVITLVSKLLNINAYESAKQINDIFNLNIEFEGRTPKIEINRYKQKQLAKERFRQWENETFILLCKYYQSLKGIEKYKEQDTVEYYIDIFIDGTDEDKLWFKKTEENYIRKIKSTLKI